MTLEIEAKDLPEVAEPTDDSEASESVLQVITEANYRREQYKNEEVEKPRVLITKITMKGQVFL